MSHSWLTFCHFAPLSDRHTSHSPLSSKSWRPIPPMINILFFYTTQWCDYLGLKSAFLVTISQLEPSLETQISFKGDNDSLLPPIRKILLFKLHVAKSIRGVGLIVKLLWVYITPFFDFMNPYSIPLFRFSRMSAWNG